MALASPDWRFLDWRREVRAEWNGAGLGAANFSQIR